MKVGADIPHEPLAPHPLGLPVTTMRQTGQTEERKVWQKSKTTSLKNSSLGMSSNQSMVTAVSKLKTIMEEGEEIKAALKDSELCWLLFIRSDNIYCKVEFGVGRRS